jgi:putative heme-binding domain-containing protein
VKHLNDANAWWRVTAQRLLVERKDKSVVPALEKATRNAPTSTGRLHALYTLEGLGALKADVVLAAMRDPDPNIRRQTALLAEHLILEAEPTNPSSSTKHAGLKEGLRALRTDRDHGVRLQAILSLGMFEPVEVASATEIEDPWNSEALLCSAASDPWRTWSLFVRANERELRNPGPAQANFVEKLAVLVGASGRESDLQASQDALKPPKAAGFPEFALFNGLAARAGSGRVSNVDWIIGPAKDAAVATNRSPAVRLAAIRVLGNSDSRLAGPVLLELLTGNDDDRLQIAAARALGGLSDPAITRVVVARWSDFSRTVRRQLLGSVSRSTPLANSLLVALENGSISPNEIDPSTRQALEKSADVDLKERAQRVFRGSVSADREEVVQRFKPATQTSGDRMKGAAIFARACLQCHEMQGRGNVLGPNIYGVASQPKLTLLNSILDPSRLVTPDYLSYTATTTDGETMTGLITAESTSGITMRRPNVPDVTIARGRITSLSAEGKSMMPDGLEQGLSVQDLADLLEFVRQPDDKLLPAE